MRNGLGAAVAALLLIGGVAAAQAPFAVDFDWAGTGRCFDPQSPVFSLSSERQFSSPLMIFVRASFTHSGHRESVWRGHPNWGLVFCHDFKSGLSDHLGVKVGLGRYLLKN